MKKKRLKKHLCMLIQFLAAAIPEVRLTTLFFQPKTPAPFTEIC